MTCATWIAKDLPPIWRDGQEYFLVGYRDGLFLVANRCPHRGGPLKFGFVNAANELVCPLHGQATPVAGLIAQADTIRLQEQRAAL